MRKRWGIWVLFVLGFLCCCLPLLAHLYSQKEQEKVIATYQKTIQEQKRDVKELRKQAEHYNSILYQTNGAALSGEDALLLGDASYASLDYLEHSRYRDYETALAYLSDSSAVCEKQIREVLKREIQKTTALTCH